MPRDVPGGVRDLALFLRVDDAVLPVHDLQRLVGKQAMTIEILEAAREVVKKSPHLFRGSGR